ncbi:MAG: ribosome-associated translation inhibitor RaiA [Candidatus Liptonbacteria bacterium]|nr:ribosome-associated translation inhibitor RaiA [Candidatus Liptonbacteria bacterium]
MDERRAEMKISIKATNLELTPSFTAYIESKLGGLSKFVNRFDKEGAVELRLEVARTTRHHHKGSVFMAEANVRLPGRMLRGVARAEDPRAAVDMLKDKLKVEIEKYKDRAEPRRRR